MSNLRGAQRARRGHLRETRNLGELILQRCATEEAMVSGSPRAASAHADGGEVYLRERRDRQQREGHHPDQQDSPISSEVAIGRRMNGSEMLMKSKAQPYGAVKTAHRCARSPPRTF